MKRMVAGIQCLYDEVHLRLTAQCARAQNGSQITRMRRILSFHGFFYFWIYLFLDFLRIVFAPVRRGLPTV